MVYSHFYDQSNGSTALMTSQHTVTFHLLFHRWRHCSMRIVAYRIDINTDTSILLRNCFIRCKTLRHFSLKIMDVIEINQEILLLQGAFCTQAHLRLNLDGSGETFADIWTEIRDDAIVVDVFNRMRRFLFQIRLLSARGR